MACSNTARSAIIAPLNSARIRIAYLQFHPNNESFSTEGRLQKQTEEEGIKRWIDEFWCEIYFDI